MPRFEGREQARGLSLLLSDMLATLQHLKSYKHEPGTPEVIGANRETSVKYLTGKCSSKKMTWLTA